MKRVMAVMVGLCLAMALGAQELMFGTMDGTLRYTPVLAEALKEAGFEVKAKGYPVQTALLEALGKGEIDGGFFLAQPVVNSVKGAVLVPVRLGESRFVALTLDAAIKIEGVADLKKYSVGIVKDHSGHVAVTRGLSVTTAPSDFEEFKLLTAGKVQVIIVLEEILPVLAKPAGLKDYYVSKSLLTSPNFLALSAAKGANKAKIEATLKKWVESKRWEEEIGKLNGVPLKK